MNKAHGGTMKHAAKHNKSGQHAGVLHAGVGMPPIIGEQTPPIGVGMPQPDQVDSMASPAGPAAMSTMKKGGRTHKAEGGVVEKNKVDKVGDPPEMLGKQFDPDEGETPRAKKGGRIKKFAGGTIKSGGAGGGDKVIHGPAHTGHTPMKKADGGTIQSGGAMKTNKTTRLPDPPEMKGGQFDPDSSSRTPMERKGGRIRKAAGGNIHKEPSTEPHGKGEPDEKPLKLAKGGHVHMNTGGHEKAGHHHMGAGGHDAAGHKFMAKMKSGGRC